MDNDGIVIRRIGPAKPIYPPASLALRLARKALEEVEQECPDHGEFFDLDGSDGPPRCPDCVRPWRVVAALAAIDRVFEDS